MPQAASIAVILNPSAGSAAGRPRIGSELADLFRASGCDPEIIEPREAKDAMGAARAASARAATVVAAGGDGTVSSVANGIIGSAAALAVIPLGTLNHFARDLGIPVDVDRAVAVAAARHVTRVDVGDVNGRLFVNNSSIGVYPDIVTERDALRLQGYAKWPAMALATVRVLRRYRGVTVTMDVDGRQRTWRTPFVFVGNNEYTIDGLRLGTRARLDGGRLFIYLTPRAHAWDLPMLFAKAVAGRAGESGAFEIVSATDVVIATRSSRRIRVAADGEVATMATALRYRTCPGALQVVVPGP